MPITGITIETDSVVIKGTDFDALCALATENEQLRKALSQRLQHLEEIRQASLTWAMTCECDCPACNGLHETIKVSSGQQKGDDRG